MHTGDGGATWTKQLDYNSQAGGNTDDADADQRRLHQHESAVAVGSDDNGAAIWHTANGGKTWTRVGRKLWPLYNTVYLTDVAFGDATHGWAISDGGIRSTPSPTCR